MLGRIKLNSIDSAISKILIVNEIRCEGFAIIIIEERIYRELK